MTHALSSSTLRADVHATAAPRRFRSEARRRGPGGAARTLLGCLLSALAASAVAGTVGAEAVPSSAAVRTVAVTAASSFDPNAVARALIARGEPQRAPLRRAFVVETTRGPMLLLVSGSAGTPAYELVEVRDAALGSPVD